MIWINNIPSFRDPESSSMSFDDRIERVELIGGNAVQNYGHIESGDVISLSCLFSVDNYRRIKELWESDSRVSYKDEAGEIWENMRLVFRSIKREAKFPEYVTLTFELWRV